MHLLEGLLPKQSKISKLLGKEHSSKHFTALCFRKQDLSLTNRKQKYSCFFFLELAHSKMPYLVFMICKYNI